MLHEASSQPAGVWNIARWARTEGAAPPLPLAVPTLHTPRGEATSHKEKIEAFRERFYPLPKAIHTGFRITNRLAAPLEIDCKVTAEQVQDVLNKAGQWKAPGPDQLPNGFLKRLGKPLFQALASLAEACWRIGYHPKLFRKAVTVILRKPGKQPSEYHQAGGWRPIALLNTMGKVI